MNAGKINVQAENIFPIIKKFLYSDQEIFLRELVSNAVDACTKLKTLSSLGEAEVNTEELLVEVIVNKKKKTLTIRDNGIGMSKEETEKYLGQIAFSGAEEFVNKYKDKAQNIIGHFGLGFYSAFMVADKVEVQTKSYKQHEESVEWICEGNPDYKISKSDKKERGTEIILHLSKDAEEYLEENKIEGLLTKYCKFLPVKIKFGTREETVKDESEKEKKQTVDNIINNTNPAWTRKPSELNQEDYNGFYRELYPLTFEDPIFSIHLNVDYPFNLTGILYFPKLKSTIDLQKNKIQLYCNQVFVSDSVEGIVPEFLTLLHGVIDSPDIPLNVSRSYLQSDSNVKKISSHITKKVADKLEEMFKNNRPDFEAKWDDIQIFIEYGMLTDEKFYERAEKFYLLKNTEGKYYTIEEYKEKIKAIQTNKDKKIVLLYTNDVNKHHSYIEIAQNRSYDVLIMNTSLSSHFIGQLEMKHTDIKITRIDGNSIEKLIEKEENIPSKLSEDQKNTLKPILEEVVDKAKFSIVFENMSEKDQPLTVTQPEFMRRMKEMSMTGGGGFYGALPDSYNLVVNTNHPIISKLVSESNTDKQKDLAKQITDLALISNNMLTGNDMTQFIKRSVDLLSKV